MGIPGIRVTFEKNYCMRKGLIFLMALCSMAAFAQEPVYDMTKTDITKLENFDAAQVNFMGLHIGMSKQEALDVLNSMTQLTWVYDDFNTKSKDPKSTDEMRIYVNRIDDAQSEKKQELLYLTWNPGSTELNRLVFYKDAASLMKGDTKNLFSMEALKAGTPLTSFLHGYPVKKEGITTTYSYTNQHFATIYMKDFDGTEKVWFCFTE